MDMTDFAALTTFVAVAEERSFTKAAKRQGVTPSAISHAMRALEISRTQRTDDGFHGSRLLSTAEVIQEKSGVRLAPNPEGPG